MEKGGILTLPRVDTQATQATHITYAWGGDIVFKEPEAISADAGSQNQDLDTPIPVPTTLLDWFLHHVTFYRLHLSAFTLVPLISSGIFYACNGQYNISYLDSLFLCYSAMTVTGLSTINLSTITVWQQVMLYLLMAIGDITTVSWVMVLIRKRFFRKHCEYTRSLRHPHARLRRNRTMFLKSISAPINAFRQRQPVPGSEKARSTTTPISPGRNINKLSVNVTPPTPPQNTFLQQVPIQRRPPPSAIPEEEEHPSILVSSPQDDASHHLSHSPTYDPHLDPTPEVPEPLSVKDFGMTSPEYGMSTGTDFGALAATSPKSVHYNPMVEFKEGRPVPRRGATMLTNQQHRGAHSARTIGMGGFPGPIDIIGRVARRAAPKAYTKLERKFTVTSMQEIDESKTAWLNFSGLITGRNSDFRIETLSDEQVEELGGAEYRALRFLSYLIPAYFVMTQVISYMLFAPWLSMTKEYDPIFEAQPREVKKPWFALFQVMGAYTGGGMSLVDIGMLPFQQAYLMIFALIFSILAGNHAMPIFLRLIIWILSRVTREGSEMEKALTFLLDHPRRCFLYLFPSLQTWHLAAMLLASSVVEWAAFLALDTGLPAYESIPVAPRVIAGLFQGLASRASGFAIVPLASFAPALQFVYIVSMYIAIYPVMLSLRSTNVYEERSLGVFEAPPDDDEDGPSEIHKLERKERIGKYIGWHLKRQLTDDIWWLVCGVFLVMTIERANIMNEDMKWFDAFRTLFELVSAFGGIGLTLGIPTENYSFVGAMKPLSKLVVIVIMVKGRHRGLPVAVDRAIQLPKDMVTKPKGTTDHPATIERNPTIHALEKKHDTKPSTA